MGFGIIGMNPSKNTKGALSFDLPRVALDQLALGERASLGLTVRHRQGDEVGEGERFAISLDRLRWPTPSSIQDGYGSPNTGRRRRFWIIHNVLKSGDRFGGESLRSLLHVLDNLPSLDRGRSPWTSTGIAALAALRGGGSVKAMPRDGAITLTDLQAPFLHMVCEPYARRGRYAVARLIVERGDAKLTDLLPALANCPRTTNPTASIYDRCKAGFEATIPRYRSLLPPAAASRIRRSRPAGRFAKAAPCSAWIRRSSES